MNVNITQIQNGSAQYLDREVFPHVPGFKKWIAIGAATLFLQNLPDTMMQYNGVLSALGVMPNKDEYDIDKLADAIRPAAEKYHETILGMTFTENDVDKLKDYIAKS